MITAIWQGTDPEELKEFLDDMTGDPLDFDYINIKQVIPLKYQQSSEGMILTKALIIGK